MMICRFKLIGCNQPVRSRTIDDESEVLPCGEPVRAIHGDQFYCEEHYLQAVAQSRKALNKKVGSSLAY